jgi:hypothetical protein
MGLFMNGFASIRSGRLHPAIGSIPLGSMRPVPLGHCDLDLRLKFQDLAADFRVRQTERRKLYGELPAFNFPVLDGSASMYPVEFPGAALNVAGARCQGKGDDLSALDLTRSSVPSNSHRITPHSLEATSIGRIVNVSFVR